MGNIHKVHDLYGRHILSRVPELARVCFVRFLPPSWLAIIDWSTLTEASQTLIDLGIKAEFLPDIVYSVELVHTDGRRTISYLLLELKSFPERMASVQIVGYMLRISEKTRSPTRPLMLYTGKRNWQIRDYWQVIAGDWAPLIEPSVTQRVDAMHLWQISDEKLLSIENYGIFLLLFKHVCDMHDEGILQTILGEGARKRQGARLSQVNRHRQSP